MKTPRNVRIDPDNPAALGKCDRGGEICMHKDLKPEMVWAGDRLVWNGFLVCDRHRDPPHPQSRKKVLGPDPIPVKNARRDT